MVYENVIKALAEQFEVEPDSLNENTSIIDDLGADSLDVVELIMSLEEMYEITISDEDAVTLDTVGKIVAYIENLR